MNEFPHAVRRYLLGECPEDEQAAFEEAYFADARVFDEVTKAESELVDDYVRGRLSPEVRRRFEQAYLHDPRRRARVKFAEALAARLDDAGPGDISTEQRDARGSGWRSAWRTVLDTLGGPRPALRLAAAVLLIVSAVVLVVESRRSREESARVESARAEQERRDRESTAHVADPPSAQTPARVEQPPSTVVTLALVVGAGVRGPDTAAPVTLAIPLDTTEVRLQLRLREHDHPTYRVILRAIGGAEILRRADLAPISTSAGQVVTLTLPAGQFDAGDYLLTLQGATGSGQFEDLSQSLFQVRRQR